MSYLLFCVEYFANYFTDSGRPLTMYAERAYRHAHAHTLSNDSIQSHMLVEAVVYVNQLHVVQTIFGGLGNSPFSERFRHVSFTRSDR